MTRWSRCRAGLLGALALALLAACSTAPPTGPPPGPDRDFPRQPVSSFVTAQGRGFQIDGAPFRFVGVNIYDAAATSRYSCDPALRMTDSELESTMRTLHDRYGASVVRFWAYQTYTASGQDWSGTDRVIRIAKQVGMRVLPVLEDGPGYCTTSAAPVPKSRYAGDTWFSSGYRAQYGTAPMSFRDYAKVVAEHYRDEPTILGWSLINEADTSARDATGRSVLVGFGRDMGQVVRSADPHHLITLGTQSNGAAGASGPDFIDVYSQPELDFAEVHDWEPWGDPADPMPGGVNGRPPAADSPACGDLHAPIGCSFARSAQLGKPLVVGEAGIHATTPAARDLRARQLDAKMRAALDAGAAGYLLWRVTKAHEDVDDITLDSGDPVLAVLADLAAGLGGP
jgi:mannan endo-1,4-beta-mannosidase